MTIVCFLGYSSRTRHICMTWLKTSCLNQFTLQLPPQLPNDSPLTVLGMISPFNKHISFSLEIQGVTLNASRELVNVGRNFAISCNVTGGPDDLNITWLKAGKVIGLSHRTKVEGKVRRSRLSVRDVMAEDEGAYICQARCAKRSLQNRELVFHRISKHFKFRQSTSLRTRCNFNLSSKSPWDISNRSNENVFATHLSNRVISFFQYTT